MNASAMLSDDGCLPFVLPFFVCRAKPIQTFEQTTAALLRKLRVTWLGRLLEWSLQRGKNLIRQAPETASLSLRIGIFLLFRLLMISRHNVVALNSRSRVD
jgi:hypothetical protein